MDQSPDRANRLTTACACYQRCSTSRCMMTTRKFALIDHPFRQGGALNRPRDRVHSAFFPIPVVAAARSSRAPIWTAA